MPQFGTRTGMQSFSAAEIVPNNLNRLRTGSYTLAGCALSALSGLGTVTALEPAEMLLIQKGPMALKPQFELSQTFNDNITFREEDPEADLYSTISPGLTVQVGDKTLNYLDFTYFYDRVEYWDRSDLSANQHRAAFVVFLEKSRLLLEGRDEFKRLASPIGGGISIGGLKVERISWVDQYRLTYDLSEKTAPYLEVLHSTSDYESGVRLYDSLTLMGTLGFEYKAFSRTSFFGEVYYGMTESDPNAGAMQDYPTADFVGGFVGVRGNFTDQLSGTAKAGYEYRWYREDNINSSAPVVELSLTERFSERTSLNASYSRRQRESVQFVRSTYTSDNIALNLLQHIGNEGRFRVNVNGLYSRSDYEGTSQATRDRNDDLLAAGLTISYDIKLWLRVFGSYDFEHLDSSEPSVEDYSANRVTLGLELGY